LNKKTIVLVIILVLALTFAGCSSANDNGSASVPENDATTETTQATDTPESTDTPEPTATPEPEIEYPTEFNSGDVLSFPNDFEVTFIGMEFTDEIHAENPNTFATGYRVTDDKNTFLDVTAFVTNLQGRAVSFDDIIDFKVVYDGKYNYDGYAVVEEADGSDLQSAYISYQKPLTTEKMHFVIEVPLEVRDSGKDVGIVLEANGSEYQYSGQEGTGEVVQMAKAKDLKTDESWQSLEAITIDSMMADDEFGELTIKSVEIKESYAPETSDKDQSYYVPNNAENIYVAATIEFKSLMTDTKMLDDLLDSKVIYDNTYTYGGFAIVETDEGKDFDVVMSTFIDPLESKTLHLINEIPRMATESGKPLVVVFEFNGKEYKYELG
jgi:hypothetical protein